MTGLIPIGIILIGMAAIVAEKKASSKKARVLIGIPSMILMMVLFMIWAS